MVKRLDTILKIVNDFPAVVLVCFSADANLAPLMWGSTRLIITFTLSASVTLRGVIDML